MAACETSESIGSALAIDASEGDVLTITTPAVSDLELTVIEAPDDVPVELYQTMELICESDNPDEIVALYAQLIAMDEMSADYDVYAVRLPDEGETEDLGEITRLEASED